MTFWKKPQILNCTAYCSDLFNLANVLGFASFELIWGFIWGSLWICRGFVGVSSLACWEFIGGLFGVDNLTTWRIFQFFNSYFIIYFSLLQDFWSRQGRSTKSVRNNHNAPKHGRNQKSNVASFGKNSARRYFFTLAKQISI